MRISKRFILTGCTALLVGATASAQTTSSQESDQQKALEALHNAESAPASSGGTASPAAPAPSLAPAPEATVPSPVVAPAPAITPAPPSAAESLENQRQALEALRKAESQPAVPDVIGAPETVSSQAAPPVSNLSAANMTASQIEAALKDAQRQCKLAEDKVQQALEDQRLAAEQARADAASRQDAAARQEELASTKVKEALERAQILSEQLHEAQVREAAEQEERNRRLREEESLAAERKRALAAEQLKAQQDAAAAADQARAEDAKMMSAHDKASRDAIAAERRKAQEEAARLAKLNQPAPAATNPAALVKEKKLADLLRRYQADEITPYEYHTQRAKIISEP